MESESKTIEISVLNLVDESRAVVGGDTAQGTEKLCAEFGELKILFVEADGTIAHEDTLVADNENNMTDDSHSAINGDYVKDETYNEDGKRRWHNVPASIKKIAVVRYEEATDFPEGCKGKDLEDHVLALASNMVKNVDRPIEKMVLCGYNTLKDTGATHMVGESLFHVWKAEVNVAPAFARFEVRSIKCTDLGAANADGDDATYDLDELKLNSLTWNYTDKTGNVEYAAPDFGAILYGVYTPAAGYTYKYDQNTCTAAERSAEYKPTTANGAWSWNVLPGEFKGLTVDIDAYAYDYQVSYEADESDRSFPLVVTGLATARDAEGNVTGEDNKFEAGNIYHIDLIFVQDNIKSKDGICVDVVVTVNPWKVVERYPIYGN